MSAAKKLIINCGAGHVSASVFSERNGGLVLEAFAAQDLDYDFTRDSEWLPHVAEAVRSVRGQVKGGDRATLIAPGYQLLTKPIKIPHVEEAKRAQIIAFEAQQQIPYPLNEVVWDHQIIADDGVETEVILIAVKSEIINDFCGSMQRQGVTPERVEAASVLDYNAYRFCYPEASEDTLLVNIGARSSNLIFVSEDGFYIRNINLGGNTLTQNLADSLGKSFSVAEDLKVAFFSGQTSVDPEDPSAQVLQSNAQSFQKKVSQEITRSIVNYRRQKSAQAPKKIILTGRGSLLPGLAESLAQSQRVPVEFFDPLAAVEVGSGVDAADLDAYQHVLSEVVGVASRMTDPEAVSINLLPEQLASAMRFAKQKPFILIGAACLALATVPPILAYAQSAAAAKAQAKELQQRVSPLNSEHAQVIDLKKEADKLRKDIASLEELVNSRSNWIVFLSDLQQRLLSVQDVWLESLKLDGEKGDRLQLSGRLLIKDWDEEDPGASYQQAYTRVNELLESFKQSDFIAGVDNLRYDTNNPRILKFEFTLVINPERPL